MKSSGKKVQGYAEAFLVIGIICSLASGIAVGVLLYDWTWWDGIYCVLVGCAIFGISLFIIVFFTSILSSFGEMAEDTREIRRILSCDSETLEKEEATTTIYSAPSVEVNNPELERISKKISELATKLNEMDQKDPDYIDIYCELLDAKEEKEKLLGKK